MAKSCVICGCDESSSEQLLEAPCQQHWVCTDDVASFFERATENESLYPPKCCGQLFLLDVYEAHVPFEVAWAFQMKAQGEYSVLAKYRVYCANPTCSKFLSPASHVKDPSTNSSYAICQDELCGKLTCTTCKSLMDGVENHVCEQNDDYKKFKQTVTEKGFQECPTCASTVELAEACNHITCECGAQFCYICGEEWKGVHGCPHYGPAIYDEEGYNQEGFHRSTGINREGRTRREQALIDHDDNGESEDEDDGREDDDPDEIHRVLQHVEPGVRDAFAALPHHEREMFLINLQIQLFEERGITFADDEEGDEESDEESEVEGDEDGDRSERNSEVGAGGRDNVPAQAGEGQTGNEDAHSDGAEHRDDLQSGAMASNVAQDGIGENTDPALAEALRLVGSFAEQAPGAADTRVEDNSTIPNNTISSPIIRDPKDQAELETSVARYLTYLSQAFSGSTSSNADVANGIAAVDRPMSAEELTNTLLRIQNDLHLETIARVVMLEALKALHLRFPENDEILRVGHTLSDLIEKDQDTASTAGTDEQQPSTPMDVDLVVKGSDQEREPWIWPLGAWPDDEEL